MKHIQTTYSANGFVITVNDEVADRLKHISITDFGEACSGILRHWGTPNELKSKLRKAIKIIEEVEQEHFKQ